MCNYLASKLNMDVRGMSIKRAIFTMPNLVKFSHFKDRELVLKNYRQHCKNHQDAVFENGKQVDADANDELGVRVKIFQGG